MAASAGWLFFNMNKNSFFLGKALKYKWKLSREISVSKLGRGYYLIKFESGNEMFYVLRQRTRVVYGDTFLFQPCDFSVLPENFEIISETFEISLHKLFPERTRIPNVIQNTQNFGTLVAFDDPIHYINGYSTMKIRLKIDITQPLISGTNAPNDRGYTNWIDFIYKELPRLFCSHCRRLGHKRIDCIEIYLLNFQNLLLQPPLEIPPQPVFRALGPFIEPDYDEDYHQEMLHNVDFEDPDPDWSDWDLFLLDLLQPLIRTGLLSHFSTGKVTR